jgi:hypothetical protein
MKKLISTLAMLTLFSCASSFADSTSFSNIKNYKTFNDCYVAEIKEQCHKTFDICMDKAMDEKSVHECGSTDDKCWETIEVICKKVDVSTEK